MHQSGLAGTADPGDAHDPPEGNRHVDSLEVVLPGCQDLEVPRRRGLRPGGRHPQGRSRRPGGDPLAPREVVRGQGIRCVEQPLDGPEKHHLSAPLSGPGAQIKHQVGGPDELRVVLDHDESVAGVAQAMQDPDQPPDVPGVQPDARLVEDEEGVHEGGSEGGGQIDPLHLAAAQGSGLAVQGQIAQAHLVQIPEARTDLPEEQSCRLIGAAIEDQLLEEPAALDDRQENELVDVEPVAGAEAP